MRRLLPALCLAALLPALPARAGEAERLVKAYPAFLGGIEGNMLVWRDGTRMPISDGITGKSAEALIANPDLDDMFAYPYPAALPSGTPPDDPGRIRNDAFFSRMYGDCRAGGVAKALVPVEWLPRHGGGRVMITAINGVADRLKAVSDELDQLGPDIIATLKPSAGTYNCRVIEGTNRPSAHGYGIAIDINDRVSDYWRWQKSGYRNRIPAVVIAAFERQGFIWGGKWRHYDTMHFEYRPELFVK